MNIVIKHQLSNEVGILKIIDDDYLISFVLLLYEICKDIYILKIVSIIPGIDEDNSFVICKWIENIIVYVNLLKNIVVLEYKILNGIDIKKQDMYNYFIYL